MLEFSVACLFSFFRPQFLAREETTPSKQRKATPTSSKMDIPPPPRLLTSQSLQNARNDAIPSCIYVPQRSKSDKVVRRSSRWDPEESQSSGVCSSPPTLPKRSPTFSRVSLDEFARQTPRLPDVQSPLRGVPSDRYDQHAQTNTRP